MDKIGKDTFSCIFAFTKNIPIGKMCPKSDDGFIKSPFVTLRCSFFIEAHGYGNLTPQSLRALHLEVFVKPSSLGLFTRLSDVSWVFFVTGLPPDEAAFYRVFKGGLLGAQKYSSSKGRLRSHVFFC